MHPIIAALLRSKTAALLVAAQVALTLAIVSNALFVVRARLATADRPSGVADEQATFQIQHVAIGEAADPATMVQRDLEVLRALPGVVAVADVNSMPMSQAGWRLALTTDPARRDARVPANAYFGGSSMVDALGLRLIEGRDFQAADMMEVDGRKTTDLRPRTTLITRHTALKLFPDGDSPVGKTIYLGSGPDAQPMQVIGVVDTLMGPQAERADTAYSSFLMPVRFLHNGSHYAVRTEPGATAAVMAAAEKALPELYRDRVLINSKTVAQMRAHRYRNDRAGATILIAVTIGLLLVTASGIVGVASLWVNRRRKQIGVRRALGARRRDIIRHFLAENLVLTTTGIAAGVALAIGLNLFLVSKVELTRLPVVYLIAGMIGLWGLGLVACLGPAWRAASVPPAIATRSA